MGHWDTCSLHWIASSLQCSLPHTNHYLKNMIPNNAYNIHSHCVSCLWSDLWSFQMLSRHRHLMSRLPPNHCHPEGHLIVGQAPAWPLGWQVQVWYPFPVAEMQATKTTKEERACRNPMGIVSYKPADEWFTYHSSEKCLNNDELCQFSFTCQNLLIHHGCTRACVVVAFIWQAKNPDDIIRALS